MINKKIKKIIATSLLTVMMATLVFGNTAFAANGAANTTQTAQENQGQYSQAAVDTAKRLIDTALRTGKEDDKSAARLYLKTLRNSELVSVYAWRMSAYYTSNYLKEDFAYFNVSKYIKANNDIREESSKKTMPLLFALNHYLGSGMLEGRSSQTDFDPMVAILVKPECVYDALLKAVPTADDVKASFKALTGKDSTKDYSVVRSASGEILTAETKAASGTGGGGSSSGGGSNPSPTPTPTPTPAPKRTATYINSYAAEAAKTFVPYQFYQDKNSATNQSVQLTDTVYGTFYGGNYQTVRNSGKKYTMMIYMTASNQEINSSYVRVSSQIASMVKAGVLDNVNVLLCVGGGGKNSEVSYYNDYMDHDIPQSGLGIYYINPAGLDSFVKKFLDKIDSEELLTDTTTGKSKDTVLSYDNLINSNTLVKLFTTNNSAIDMGDPKVLSGFMNMCSQLYPAQDYGLSLSNHGGGLETGVCRSVLINEGSPIEGTPLTVSELETAFAASDIFKNTDATGTADGKLGLLFYDACLMGSTEQAYALKDYYRYMLASEEVTSGHTDYYTLLTAINNAAMGTTVDDAMLATNLLKTFKTTYWHHGNTYDEATIAVYSSANIENAIKAISTAGTNLAGLLDKNTVNDAGTLSNKIFTAVRRTMLSCNDYNSDSTFLYASYKNQKEYVDAGEFFSYLRKNIYKLIVPGDSLTDQVIADNAAIQKLLTDIDAVLKQGYITNSNMYYSGTAAVDSDNSDTVISMENMKNNQTPFWQGYNGTASAFYGASLFLPFLGSEDEKDGTLARSKYTGFKNSALAGYIDFLNKYLSCNNSYIGPVFEDGKSISIKEICTPSQVGIQLVNGVEYLTFEFNTEYTSEQKSKLISTTGSPMQDVAEMTRKFEMVLVDEKNGTNTVYALKNVNDESIKLDADKVVIDIKDIKNTNAYYIQGEDNIKYYLPLSQIEFDEYEKSSVKAVTSAKVGEKDFLTFKGSTGMKTSSDKEVLPDVYHVFFDDGLTYVCTVKAKATIDPSKPEERYDLVDEDTYNRFKCYSYSFNHDTGLISSNSETDKYWTLDYGLETVFLYNQSGSDAGKVDITTTGVAITTDGENCTSTQSLAGVASEKPEEVESPSQTSENNDPVIESAVAENPAETAIVTEVVTVQDSMPVDSEPIQEAA